MNCALCKQPIGPNEDCCRIEHGFTNEEGVFIPAADPEYAHQSCEQRLRELALALAVAEELKQASAEPVILRWKWGK